VIFSFPSRLRIGRDTREGDRLVRSNKPETLHIRLWSLVPHPLVSISETAGGHEGRWECQPNNAPKPSPVQMCSQVHSITPVPPPPE